MIINLLLAFALGALTAVALLSRRIAKKENALRAGAAELRDLMAEANQKTAAIKVAQGVIKEQTNSVSVRIEQVKSLEEAATRYLSQAALRQATVGLETASDPAAVGDALACAREAMPPLKNQNPMRYMYCFVDEEVMAQCRETLLLLRRGEQGREDSEEWLLVWDRWLDVIEELQTGPEPEPMEGRWWECDVCAADLRGKPGTVCQGCKRYELDSDH